MDVLIFNSVSESIKRAINKKCGLNLSQTRLLLFFDRYETAYFRNGVKRKPTSKPRGPRKTKKSI